PYEPEKGHRFNHNKLLVDPYARVHIGLLKWDDTGFGYTIGSPEGDLSFDERDSAPFVPKCMVVDPRFEWRQETRRHQVPWDQTTFYELHVRGYTKLHPKVPKKQRGTFAGLSNKDVISYIKALGVTTVELLPVFTFVNDRILLDKGLTDYWGYNTIGFFAPDPRYAAVPRAALQEFKEMIARYHDAGIEMILDVVYNHTSEGNEPGPTLSFKGIDNASYYRLMPDKPRYYINDTGTGNTVNLSHARVMQMVTDSLRYWVQETEVDGFRFDLGTILAREPSGFDHQSAFLKTCSQDPVLGSVKLIAEPWDIGPGGYQVGEFPPGWAEWNDKFRDTVRSFWKGDDTAGALAPRFCASADIFNRRGRKPWSSINFVTAHDGFTLNDLVSYNEKHNEANGEDNRDGESHNRSSNCGVEAPTDDPEILELRERQMRNIMATLMVSQGTPMIAHGDEIGRGQHGNNNVYCQDSELSWMDWSLVDKNSELLEFTRKVTALRKAHPVFRRRRFFDGEPIRSGDEVRDIAWLTPAGKEMQPQDWGGEFGKSSAVFLNGEAIPEPNARGERVVDDSFLMCFNAHGHEVDFIIPPDDYATEWTAVLDTTDATGSIELVVHDGDEVSLPGRALLIFRKTKERMAFPVMSTFRLQLRGAASGFGFTFADAENLLDSLDDLGVSHLYLSPILTPVTGSGHGYDVTDPTTGPPELGGAEGLGRLSAAARARGMGLIVDVVPNHVGV